MKVVMVDDSPADRNLCKMMLEEALGPRLEYFEAATAANALATCRETAPDCVLVDYKLPDMNGLELLRRLRAENGGAAPSLAAVMLTGLADEQIAVDAMKAGAQDYLIKDRITPESLLAAIENAHEKAGLMRSLQAERDRLARSLSEKEILLKEVHHRVKNNLQVIASLLRLQANRLPAGETADALRASQHRVESMAMIHEQLYDTEDLREVNLGKHASMLAANLFHSYGIDPGRVSWHVAISAPPLGVDRAIPAGLILNELISNALKHAFPEGRSGAVQIEGNASNADMTLAVRDNGIGVPADINSARPKSLGLEIVKILTAQLKGTLEVDRSAGTAFRITFPIK
jgi:two-component sensor histidine kinase/CheY-like chemotaxis protein